MTETLRFHPSRRRLLAGGATLAGAAMLAPWRGARAQAAFSLGAHEISVLSDGHLTLPMGFVLPEQSAAEIAAVLEPHGLPTDALVPDCNVTLLRSGDRLVLFDVGAGANFQSSAGDLPDRLEEAGIDPSDITDIVLTHAHPDHLWGILDDFDDPLYPEATVHVPEEEWAYWRADDTLEKTPEDRKSFVVGAQSRFEVIEDRVAMIRAGSEVLPGVEAVATPGHTPGHMSYVIHGGNDSVMVVGDALTNTLVSFERPEWAYGSDHDRDLGVKTRLALLDRLAGDGTRLIGYHFPHPGQGRVERAGTAYRFVAD